MQKRGIHWNHRQLGYLADRDKPDVSLKDFLVSSVTDVLSDLFLVKAMIFPQQTDHLRWDERLAEQALLLQICQTLGGFLIKLLCTNLVDLQIEKGGDIVW